MIKTILLTASASMLLNASSCSKNGTSMAHNTVTGTWKLVLMTGGIGSVHITAAQWGHTRSYTLQANGNYTRTEDGKATSGNYSVGEEILRGSNTVVNTVTLDGTEKYTYSFAHDTLIISMYGISDPMFDWYVKQ